MTSQHDKLIFDAVLYVLGDMPASERETFEQRLIDDQTAREAVAEAVRLCQVTHDALIETMPPHTSLQRAVHVDQTWRRVAVWAATAMAASIMLALVMEVGRDRKLPGRHQDRIAADGEISAVENNADRKGMLAVAWLNSASLDDVVEEDSNDDIAGSESLNSETLDDAVDQEELAMAPSDNGSALEADWFFEAVSSPPAESAGPTTSTSQEG